MLFRSNPSEGALAWGSLSRAVRSPSRVDRDLFAPAQPPFFFAGGPDFRSETANVAELGYRAQPSRTFFYSVTAFHHVHDRIRSVEPTASGAVIANGIEGRTSGVEAWATFQAATRWRLKVGGVYLRERLRLKAESRATSVAGEGKDRKSTRLNSSHIQKSRMPSSA